MIRAIAPDPFDAPLSDRQSINVFLHHWNELTAQSEALEQPTLVTTRCLPVDSDRIATMTADEWETLMALKYGRDFAGGE